MNVNENVVGREVVFAKVLSPGLWQGRALSLEVVDCRLVVASKRASLRGGGFVYFVQVFVTLQCAVMSLVAVM